LDESVLEIGDIVLSASDLMGDHEDGADIGTVMIDTSSNQATWNTAKFNSRCQFVHPTNEMEMFHFLLDLAVETILKNDVCHLCCIR